MGDSLGDLIDIFSDLALSDRIRVIQPPVEVRKNDSLLAECLSHTNTSLWECIDQNVSYQLVQLSEYSREYLTVRRKFLSTSPLKNVIRIERVQNSLLYIQYHLKMKQKQSRHGYVSEHDLYHGTKSCHIDSICNINFDWRRMGSSGYRFSKFGRGISFSPRSQYASAFPRGPSIHSDRVMFVAKVMVVTSCQGVPDLEIPPEPADTSDYETAWNSSRVEQQQVLTEQIADEEKAQWGMEGQTLLMQAKRENVALQLEATYRERLLSAYAEVKKRLDYQVEKQNIERRVTQKNLVDWVVAKVKASYTPDQEKQNINKCIADLALLARA